MSLFEKSKKFLRNSFLGWLFPQKKASEGPGVFDISEEASEENSEIIEGIRNLTKDSVEHLNVIKEEWKKKKDEFEESFKEIKSLQREINQSVSTVNTLSSELKQTNSLVKLGYVVIVLMGVGLLADHLTSLYTLNKSIDDKVTVHELQVLLLEKDLSGLKKCLANGGWQVCLE